MKNLYFLCGKEKLSINKRISRIIKESNVDEFNITSYDLEIDKLDNAINDCLTVPFMSNIKVVIIKNPTFLLKSSKDDEIKNLINYLKSPMESTILIINACNIDIDEKKEVVNEIKKSCEVISVKKPSEIEVFGWLKMQCNFVGIDIKEEAIRTFFNLIGTNDLQKAKNEVDKLINYVGKGGIITTDIVNQLVMKDIESDIYQLVNMIMNQKKSLVLKTYDDLLKSGNDTVSILNRVSKSMRINYSTMIMLNNGYNQADIEKILQISSKQAFYLVKNVRQYDLNVIKHHICLLGDLDYRIKSGKIDSKVGFEYFLLAI